MAGLALRGLTYYWRTNLAVVLGVGTAVSVLSGALLVGDSVRGSLRDLVVGRLGKTDVVVFSSGFFREQLASDISGASPLVVAQGMVTVQESGRRAGQVRVYGVDDRFWRFHGISDVSGPANRDAFVSPALADQLGADTDDVILVRVQRPTDIPLESLHGRRDDVGRTLRLTVRRVLPASLLGEFSLEAQQGDVRAVFMPLSRLQQDLALSTRVNTLLVARNGDVVSSTNVEADLQVRRVETSDNAEADLQVRRVEDAIRRSAQLEDVGLYVKTLTGTSPSSISIGADGGLLDDAHAAAVEKAVSQAGLAAQPMFTYLANSLRVGD